jgi:hypothetical protein
MTLDEWFDMNDGRNLKRLAELGSVNRGSFQVDGPIGTSEVTDQNRYGRLGLTVNEAFELTYLKGGMDALINAHGNPQVNLKKALDRLTCEAQGRLIEIASPEQTAFLLRK